jgi:hypothetical protein
MALPKYLSETITVGPRTYQVEVKKHRRGGKYMIITQTGLRNEDQQPVIVFEAQMSRFARMMERAATAVLTNVPQVDGTKKRQKKVKANPPEFCNSGKRWTPNDDRLLTEHFHGGTPMERMMEIFKRRSGAIEVRLYKLGLLPPRNP